jgi:hypothetical protein
MGQQYYYASAGTKQFVANVAKDLAKGQAVAIGIFLL